MEENMKYPEKMVFGLDIGTRSLVGSVGYMDKGKFNVVAHTVKEHETRAMLDGQIHDIKLVGESIAQVRRKLEEELGRKLDDVCIAAAGRVLKTVTVSVESERSDENAVTEEEIYSLDLLGVEKAYDIMRKDYPDVEFYCVGYTVVKYYMNDYIINNLEGHRAKKIRAEVLATFLPHEVVDSLYSAVEAGGLTVSNLTLEPIAAINVAIPEQFRLLNIALVDVGAGTSDICITKDGSIIAYGMIPHAGDEITEVIMRECLVDFNTADKIKIDAMQKKSVTYNDIMGLSHKLTSEEVQNMYKATVSNMTSEIAAKIKELNGGKSVSAVFVVGGGGKAHGFIEELADNLEIQRERVALRGAEVLTEVNFLMEDVKKDPLLVTPIGICINYYAQKNNFIIINVNDKRVKLYDNDKLSVIDAVMQAGITNMDLFPKRGNELKFTFNGNEKLIRGGLGEAAMITVNEKEANLNTKVGKSDKVYISPSTAGDDAKLRLDEIPEYNTKLTFNVNGRNVDCPRVAMANDELVTGSYEIQNNDKISIPEYYMLSQLLKFMDIDMNGKKVFVNGHKCVGDEPVYADFKVLIEESFNTESEDEISGDEAYTEDIVEETVTKKVEVKTTMPPSNSNSNFIVVTVNGTPITLRNKSSYIFVDILDVYPFDTTTPGGTMIVIKRNGIDAGFSTPINDGDSLELYWKK